MHANLTSVIGEMPFRMAFAGGWIDQPFVSQHNPSPPGSMVVVALEPTCRFMNRCGSGDQYPRDRYATLGRRHSSRQTI